MKLKDLLPRRVGAHVGGHRWSVTALDEVQRLVCEVVVPEVVTGPPAPQACLESHLEVSADSQDGRLPLRGLRHVAKPSVGQFVQHLQGQRTISGLDVSQLVGVRGQGPGTGRSASRVRSLSAPRGAGRVGR